MAVKTRVSIYHLSIIFKTESLFNATQDASVHSFFNLFFWFSDTSVKYKTFTELSKISPKSIHTTNAVAKISKIDHFQKVYVIFLLTLLGVAIVMFPVVILIYKIIT